MRKHRDIKLVTTERRRNYLVSEPNYHTTKLFKEYLLAMEIKQRVFIKILKKMLKLDLTHKIMN